MNSFCIESQVAREQRNIYWIRPGRGGERGGGQIQKSEMDARSVCTGSESTVGSPSYEKKQKKKRETQVYIRCKELTGLACTGLRQR